MIAMIEFVLIGFIFAAMLKATNPEIPEKKIVLNQIVRKIINEFWLYFLYPVTIIILALAISYNVQDWAAELRSIVVSSIMLFIGFLMVTAVYLRMREKI